MVESITGELLKDSWYRCYKKNINKKLNKFNKYVSQNELKKIKNDNNYLVKLFMKQIKLLTAKYVSDKSYLFLLTDSDGVLMAKHFCNYNEKESNFQLKEGAYFTEDSCGTNAISLAINTNNIVHLKGDEHYCDCFYDWESIATPIIVNKKVVAYLNMSIFDREIAEIDNMLFELLLSKLVAQMTKIIFFSGQEKIILNELTEEILKLSAIGHTITEISAILHISHSAVKYHRSKVCDFLEAKNLYHAITKAIKYRCLDLKKIE